MLITSLPKPVFSFGVTRPPLSRIKLERRLRELSVEHAQLLKVVERALAWRYLPMSCSEKDVIQKGKQALEQVHSKTLKNIIHHRLEMRTCMAAMRRRYRGENPPQNNEWGFGRWNRHIIRHWRDDGFLLERVFPWIREAHQLMQSGRTLALEKLLLHSAYLFLQRQNTVHMYDIEAVIIYVLKWDIVNRFVQYNEAEAVERFEQLTEQALGHVFPVWGENHEYE